MIQQVQCLNILLECNVKLSDIASDNGRNFVGDNKELRAVLKSLFKGSSQILIILGMKWKII